MSILSALASALVNSLIFKLIAGSVSLKTDFIRSVQLSDSMSNCNCSSSLSGLTPATLISVWVICLLISRSSLFGLNVTPTNSPFLNTNFAGSFERNQPCRQIGSAGARIEPRVFHEDRLAVAHQQVIDAYMNRAFPHDLAAFRFDGQSENTAAGRRGTSCGDISYIVQNQHRPVQRPA